MEVLKSQLIDLFESTNYQLSTLKPSEWAEKNRIMTTDVSPRPGPFKYNYNPYTREIVDCLDPNHPASTIAVMKGAQIGFSASVIENGIGYVISQCPGNILLLTGHSDLSEEAMVKIDQMIDSCGLRDLIRPNTLRKRNQRSGDTNKSKEFPGGSLVAGSAGNHKLLRQRSVKIGFIDDFDAAKQSTKESGSTIELIEQRFAAYSDKMKLFFISTPELKRTSNIEPVYLKGDQRKYNVPCPCCNELITLEWEIKKDKKRYGITYKTDAKGDLIDGSVGYTCQKCGEFFKDNHKYEMLLNGKWIPTATPSRPGYYSYHISSLYAPPGMYDWTHYVRQYLEANPFNAPQKVKKMQTFVNLCLGETFEEKKEAPKANVLQRNVRNYKIGTLPEKLSESDGNGKIILLTCACDLNGTVDDARLDYEVLAWTESGSNYSIDHGSIGTFIPNENSRKVKVDREKWTYRHNEERSVWPCFEEVISKIYESDTGKRMRVVISGVDTGHYTAYAYTFLNNTSYYVVGLKGQDVTKSRTIYQDTASFKKSKERGDLFILEVNQLKDELAENMKLRWNKSNDQPPNFMNYPMPSDGKYTFSNYFSHYESEHKIIESKDGEDYASKWVKKRSNVQNHLFDCRVYNIALRDIIASEFAKNTGLKTYTWRDIANILMKILGHV